MLQSVKPFISTTTLTCGTTVASATVTSSAAFGSVVAGQAVFGAGIPFGTTVTSVTDTSTIIISKIATATAASASLQFSYYTSAAYTAADVLGFPFQLDMKKIGQIYAIDNDKVITALKGYVFSSPFTPTLDNAAFAPSDADAAKVIGYFSLTTSNALTNNTVIYSAVTDMPLWIESAKVRWCQLVAVGTPTFAAVNSLTVNFLGE